MALRATSSTFVLTFIIGLVFGAIISGFFFKLQEKTASITQKGPRKFSVSKILDNDPSGHVQVDKTNEVSTHESKRFQEHTDVGSYRGEDTVATDVKKKVKILIWVATHPDNKETKLKHLKATWGKRFEPNEIIYISSQDDPDFPIIGLKLEVPEGRDALWAKTRAAFKYVYDNHFNDADWFMKADDDTYVIAENLRHFLSDKDPSQPHYFGRRFKPYVRKGYMSGGSGYVISKEALKRVVTKAFPDSTHCRGPTHPGAEDVEMGKCLDSVGVYAGDSRDSLGRERFHPFVPDQHLTPGTLPSGFWYWQYIYYKTPQGLECCSDETITFHYVGPNLMYSLEYMVYHMRPFGVEQGSCSATQLA
ncbi:glycoprotein-N-acetylgalactosamine 3-beta-galactosyltransferase 1-like [Ptychodera flava]|uniref:glycoprotein-N-acetylgalactosamine 3-beta-galactosyltransferase 1-like n=1 Tax=Ptychodera flava TaxID=63121 RepID=UPI00396A28A9